MSFPYFHLTVPLLPTPPARQQKNVRTRPRSASNTPLPPTSICVISDLGASSRMTISPLSLEPDCRLRTTLPQTYRTSAGTGRSPSEPWPNLSHREKPDQRASARSRPLRYLPWRTKSISDHLVCSLPADTVNRTLYRFSCRCWSVESGANAQSPRRIIALSGLIFLSGA